MSFTLCFANSRKETKQGYKWISEMQISWVERSTTFKVEKHIKTIPNCLIIKKLLKRRPVASAHLGAQLVPRVSDQDDRALFEPMHIRSGFTSTTESTRGLHKETAAVANENVRMQSLVTKSFFGQLASCQTLQGLPSCSPVVAPSNAHDFATQPYKPRPNLTQPISNNFNLPSPLTAAVHTRPCISATHPRPTQRLHL